MHAQIDRITSGPGRNIMLINLSPLVCTATPMRSRPSSLPSRPTQRLPRAQQSADSAPSAIAPTPTRLLSRQYLRVRVAQEAATVAREYPRVGDRCSKISAAEKARPATLQKSWILKLRFGKTRPSELQTLHTTKLVSAVALRVDERCFEMRSATSARASA